MAITQGLGLGKIGIKKVLLESAKKVEDQGIIVVGKKLNTNETYERMKTIIGYGMAAKTPEGTKVAFDDLQPLFVRDFYPYIVAKGVKFTFQAWDTDQYGVFRQTAPQVARVFVHTKNQLLANLNNNGFTDTTSGMNSETLYSVGHSNGGGLYGANRPLAVGQVAGPSATALDIAFGPLAVEQMLQELRQQKDARGLPMPKTGKVRITLPSTLEGLANRVVKSEKLQGTNNNDINWSRERVTFDVIDYYTSSTAWFARMDNDDEHGLFVLQQKDYQIEELAKTDDLMKPFVMYEIYVPGWMDYRGTWGTLGA